MKQRISTEDLKSLTPSQQEKLRAWWKPQFGDVFSEYFRYEKVVFSVSELGEIFTDDNDEGFMGSEKQDCLPLLSIGQCIELLYQYTDVIEIETNWYEDCERKWRLDAKGIDEEHKELIDALFEAVKSIL